ncbi:MAG TPA: hypothetical protein VGY48_15645 [Vicinamibacterales bacterium]|jgi:hypothetical protein|nr:hypothetical protein [Vicinamibacterales bacterium]
MRLFIKGSAANAKRAAARRGIPVRDCFLTKKGDAAFCDAPESARPKVMEWYREKGSVVQAGRGYTPGSLLFFAGARRRKRSR